MHELAVCQALVGQLQELAAHHQAPAVVSARVQIGPLSGVEQSLLEHAWPFACAGTVAEGAQLQFESMPLIVACEACGAQTPASPNRLLCGVCHSWHTRVVSGDALVLASVELAQ